MLWWSSQYVWKDPKSLFLKLITELVKKYMYDQALEFVIIHQLFSKKHIKRGDVAKGPKNRPIDMPHVVKVNLTSQLLNEVRNFI